MGSRLDGEYSATCVATEVACYSPSAMFSRSGASGRSDDGILEWVVGSACGKGVCWDGVLKRSGTGVTGWIFALAVNGCVLGTVHGCFLIQI